MKKEFKQKILLVVSLSIFSLWGQGTLLAQISESTTRIGTTAAQFLKIGAGARPLALGGAFSAVEGDINNVYWNPAGLVHAQGLGAATFNHADWLAGMNYDFAAVSLNLGSFGTVALSGVSFRVPEDIVRTLQNEEGDGRRFDAGSMALGLTYARALTDRFSFGVTFKYINERIWNESANGIAFDVGTLFITPFNDLKIGASMSNFGSKMRLEGRDLFFNLDPNPGVSGGPKNIPSQYRLGEYDMPLVFRVGVAMDVLHYDVLKATVAVDATHPNDNTEYLNMGVELSYNRLVYGRLGYKSLFLKDSEQKLTWGLGIRYEVTASNMIMLDYAFADYGRLLNIQHLSISVSY